MHDTTSSPPTERKYCPACGVEQPSDVDDDLMMPGVHENGCIVVTKFDIAGRIAAVCRQIDERLGNVAGTAVRGCFWAFWPPSPTTDMDVLRSLLDDARDVLDTTNTMAA